MLIVCSTNLPFDANLVFRFPPLLRSVVFCVFCVSARFILYCSFCRHSFVVHFSNADDAACRTTLFPISFHHLPIRTYRITRHRCFCYRKSAKMPNAHRHKSLVISIVHSQPTCGVTLCIRHESKELTRPRRLHRTYNKIWKHSQRMKNYEINTNQNSSCTNRNAITIATEGVLRAATFIWSGFRIVVSTNAGPCTFCWLLSTAHYRASSRLLNYERIHAQCSWPHHMPSSVVYRARFRCACFVPHFVHSFVECDMNTTLDYYYSFSSLLCACVGSLRLHFLRAAVR